MNEQSRYEYTSDDMDEREANLKRLTAGEVQEFNLSGSERVDIFTGSPEADNLPDDANDLRRFSVIDLRGAERADDGSIIHDGQKIRQDTAYLLIQPATLDWDTGRGYKGLRLGDVHDVGRKQGAANRFEFSPETSGNHFAVAVTQEGTLIVGDNMSTNGTSYAVRGERNTTEKEVPTFDSSGESQSETEAEMYERFYQETRAELQQLYEEHRAARPGSDEMHQLESSIKYAKEDAGKYARLAAKAKGNTNWL